MFTTKLPIDNIALSSYAKPHPIVIIDSSSYQIVRMIQLKKYITYYSSLCVFDEHSFIYAYDGTFLQISNEDGSVLFHSKGGRFLKKESTLLLRMVQGYQSLNLVLLNVVLV